MSEWKKTERKQGQLVTEIFVYVAGAAVFLLILVVGYKHIISLIDTQNTTLLVDFQTKLASTVQKLQIRRGSVDIVTFAVPSSFTKLCIADSSGRGTGTFESDFPQLYRAWKTSTENVFLLPKQSTPFYLEGLEVPNGYFCTDIEGKFKLRLEGRGRTVRVEPA